MPSGGTQLSLDRAVYGPFPPQAVFNPAFTRVEVEQPPYQFFPLLAAKSGEQREKLGFKTALYANPC